MYRAVQSNLQFYFQFYDWWSPAALPRRSLPSVSLQLHCVWNRIKCWCSRSQRQARFFSQRNGTFNHISNQSKNLLRIFTRCCKFLPPLFITPATFRIRMCWVFQHSFWDVSDFQNISWICNITYTYPGSQLNIVCFDRTSCIAWGATTRWVFLSAELVGVQSRSALSQL